MPRCRFPRALPLEHLALHCRTGQKAILAPQSRNVSSFWRIILTLDPGSGDGQPAIHVHDVVIQPVARRLLATMS